MRATGLYHLNRHRGCLLGLATGDALGTTLEFQRPGSFEPIHDMVGGGPFDLEPGQWTDDTSMALCLAESLLASDDFDAKDQMQRYVRWYRDGYLSSTGRCFDIGNTCSLALEQFERTGEAFAGSTDPKSAGNGSIMRLAPVAMRWAADLSTAVDMAARSSQTTHGTAEAVDACQLLAALMVGALHGEPKGDLLGAECWPTRALLETTSLTPRIAEIAHGSFMQKQPPEIRGTGYVVESLEAALWAFAESESFEEGALLAVNLGDDADTTGAVFGQIAGAFYGAEAIPARWLERLAMRDKIEVLALGLMEAAEQEVGDGVSGLKR
jgi:ADP-ribosyl-[dinitrogen reductase] hydrolase